MTSRDPLPVLIVDDSAVARQALRAIVEVEQGFVALLASDPYEAVEVMKRTVPAAIVLDVNMPRMDGPTFRSTAQAAGDRAVGVILTGMLDDSAGGCSR